MPIKIACRGQVAPFIAMDVMRQANERAAEGADVLHLEVGQPSTPAPAKSLAAVRAAVESSLLGYTDALGMGALRTALAAHYEHMYGAIVDANRIAITTGSSSGFLLSFLAAFDVGDRVAVIRPGYPAYRNIMSALGLVPVEIAVTAATRFQPTIKMLERIEGRLDGLLLASPANPTGTMLEDDEMKAIIQWCDHKGVRFISDEIYHGITYGKKSISAVSSSGDAIIVNSFSKLFSMTGWRIGWIVLPVDLVRPVERLAQSLFISPPAVSQVAALAALAAKDEVMANIERYAANRTLLLDGLAAIGLPVAPADGAFYLYADASSFTNDSESFCRRMLAETGVATTPGCDFDPVEGQRFLRFSYAGCREDIELAVDRLRRWFPDRCPSGVQ